MILLIILCFILSFFIVVVGFVVSLGNTNSKKQRDAMKRVSYMMENAMRNSRR